MLFDAEGKWRFLHLVGDVFGTTSKRVGEVSRKDAETQRGDEDWEKYFMASLNPLRLSVLSEAGVRFIAFPPGRGKGG